jgi:hypothetical protein
VQLYRKFALFSKHNLAASIITSNNGINHLWMIIKLAATKGNQQ